MATQQQRPVFPSVEIPPHLARLVEDSFDLDLALQFPAAGHGDIPVSDNVPARGKRHRAPMCTMRVAYASGSHVTTRVLFVGAGF
ncbi:hypothetical protein AMTR_s00056p00124860 [Amborella trichopoda]|uniref:Uncharacterized protein n=1 Tax=Amborella trichopoda TaxID=13333 RepID=U5CYA7_AMBTC|nr:hypothetical protein AMTR_s00056p00124860 [Amborella trichopoda]